MTVEGLTRLNVKSHLQKYKLKISREQVCVWFMGMAFCVKSSPSVEGVLVWILACALVPVTKSSCPAESKLCC